jgi:protein TonB
MTSQGGGAVITAKVAGRSRRLATEKHWRAAIASGDLKPDSEVEYEAAYSPPAIRSAGDVPELRALFAELLPGFSIRPAAAEPPQAETATTQTDESQASAQRGPLAGATRQGDASPGSDSRSPPVAAKPTPARPGGADTNRDRTRPAPRKQAPTLPLIGVLMVLAALALLGLVYLVSRGPASETETAGEVAAGSSSLPSYTPVPSEGDAAAEPQADLPPPEPAERSEPQRKPRPSQPAARPTQTPTAAPTIIVPPPPQPVSQARRVQPRDLGRWAGRIGSDYPTRARERGEEGTVRFRVTVSPDGRVADCQVIGSSGSSDLDRAACQGLRRHARFYPALNDAGEPITDSWSSSLTYRLD